VNSDKWDSFMLMLIIVMLVNVGVYDKELFYQKFLMLTKGAYAISSNKSNHYSYGAKTTRTHHYLYSWNEQIFQW
jgi:hypothetical protein